MGRISKRKPKRKNVGWGDSPKGGVRYRSISMERATATSPPSRAYDSRSSGISASSTSSYVRWFLEMTLSGWRWNRRTPSSWTQERTIFPSTSLGPNGPAHWLKMPWSLRAWYGGRNLMERMFTSEPQQCYAHLNTCMRYGVSLLIKSMISYISSMEL